MYILNIFKNVMYILAQNHIWFRNRNFWIPVFIVCANDVLISSYKPVQDKLAFFFKNWLSSKFFIDLSFVSFKLLSFFLVLRIDFITLYMPGKHSTSPQVMFRIKLSKCWLRCLDTICNCVISTRRHFVVCSLEILFCNEGTVDWKLPKPVVNKQASFSSVFFVFVSRRKEKEISFFLWKERSPGEEMKITGDAFSLSKQLGMVKPDLPRFPCQPGLHSEPLTQKTKQLSGANSQQETKFISVFFGVYLFLSFVHLFIGWLIDWDRVPLYRLGLPGAHNVDQVSV